MKKTARDVAIVLAIAVVVLAGMWATFKLSDAQQRDREREIQAQRDKYGCKPTNEFVGKDAQRLWLCQDGIKYPADVFYYWARDARK